MSTKRSRIHPKYKTEYRVGGQSQGRDQTIRRIEEIGRRAWMKESGYHRQGGAENAFFRYKTIVGDFMRSRGADARAVEATVACNMLNRMTELGIAARGG